jgi:hypothetical protein
MSYQEKKTIISVVTGTLLLAAYCIYAFGQAGMAQLNNLKFWANTMLIFIGIGVVAMIVIQIVFHILLSIAMAVKQKLNNENCDDKEIEKALQIDMVEDEMDKLIELKANRVGYTFVSVGFVSGLVSLAFGASAVVMLNIAFLSCLVGSLVEGLIQLRYYRKGI